MYIDRDEAILDDDQLVNDIIQQNNLKEYSGNIEMKIVKRIINDKKQDFSIIVEANPELHKVLLVLEKFSLGWKQCKVFDHINLIRCFKCCGFNHYANDCKRKTTCSKCGGAHHNKDCKAEYLKCANCAQSNEKTKNSCGSINDDKHNAFDKKCPIYIKLIEYHKKINDESI